MSKYTQSGLTRFPALDRLNAQADRVMNRFRNFLIEVRELLRIKQLHGTLVPLVPDHMEREECYYLIKLSLVSAVPMPDCDPTRPRIEA